MAVLKTPVIGCKWWQSGRTILFIFGNIWKVQSPESREGRADYHLNCSSLQESNFLTRTTLSMINGGLLSWKQFVVSVYSQTDARVIWRDNTQKLLTFWLRPGGGQPASHLTQNSGVFLSSLIVFNKSKFHWAWHIKSLWWIAFCNHHRARIQFVRSENPSYIPEITSIFLIY